MEIVGQWWEKGLTNDQINKIKCQQKQCQYILIRFNSINSFKQKPKKQKIKGNNKMIFDRKITLILDYVVLEINTLFPSLPFTDRL